MELSAHTVDELFVDVLTALLQQGRRRAPRGMECYSLGPLVATLHNPRARVLWNGVRKAKREFMAGEFTWIISGSKDLEQIAFYNSGMRRYSDDNMTLFGAYGPWVVKQLPYVIDCLKRDRDSRQAVMTIWQQNPPATKDVPCTVSMQFRIVEDKLEMTTYMRSNDIWLGFPYDIFTFTCIQEVVAGAVAAGLGPYHHVVGDMHLYEVNAAAAFFAKTSPADSEIMPALESDLADLQAVLKSTDSVARKLKHAVEKSKDPFIGWIQDRIIERRKGADKTGAVS